MRGWQLGVLTLALLCWAVSAQAETVIKLDLGLDPLPDVRLEGGTFSTQDNGNNATLGQQDSNVLFLDFLYPAHEGIDSGNASFSLRDVMLSGAPEIVSNMMVVQPTQGGVFELYDTDNTLLLAGTLAAGALSGPVDGAGTGAFLSVTFGTFTDGTLAPLVDPSSAALSISLTEVVTGGLAGLRVENGAIQNFTADATANLAAVQVPEPSATLLVLCGCLGVVGAMRRRGRAISG